jgi:hypothetical protein
MTVPCSSQISQHAPLMHDFAAEHFTPHAPQLFESVWVSKQIACPPQHTVPEGSPGHAVLSASAGATQAPAPLHWSAVQRFESSEQAVPAGAMIGAQVAEVPLQVSGGSQGALPALQTVSLGSSLSTQPRLLPSQ